MAPVNRERIAHELLKKASYRASAVMVLFCVDEAGTVFIPLIERMAYKGVHSAQISLPGGKFEPGDADLEHTAIRECFEEIGVSDTEIIGKLTELHIPVSGFLVQPFVGICNVINPKMVNQEREVKTILKLTVEALMNGETVKNGAVQVMENLRMDTPYFELGEHRVWGATAMILSELKEILKPIF